MTDQPVPRVAHYDYPRPTTASMLEVLERYLGDDEAEATWRTLCARVGVDTEEELEPDALLKVVDALENESALLASCAKGLRIRVMTYAVLGQSQQHFGT